MAPIRRDEIEKLLLDCIEQLNQMRTEDEKLTVSVDAPLFGEGSPLDSLALVTLVLDMEDALADRGIAVNLSDARAMSRARSPYRSVASMTDLVLEICSEQSS